MNEKLAKALRRQAQKTTVGASSVEYEGIRAGTKGYVTVRLVHSCTKGMYRYLKRAFRAKRRA